ncbi:translational GTPase TypA [Vagococcus carniphilus]|uniref:50S ribosomal subunit assembly factor BipA n=1 Tax=Vagococcus carniphilus TaxID=218144 RepID=A0A430B7Q1_9ENTE|nr:translational GTPase TypA [Vagococcus carniphilus]QNN74501.1 translational GTPase TypA [Vagococcus carniphilus]RSU16288.1 translational GTPase TypA [Vagococcus carniphilus]
MSETMMNKRNVAIIAHVDHGKTSLVNELIKETNGLTNRTVEERALDSNELEKERGITILAKATSIYYKETTINIVDTPGHADFGGEVERIMGMVDGVVIVIDAFEGPMPQTRFVLEKALAYQLPLLTVVNKVDRKGANPKQAVDQLLDLLIELGVDEEQLDFPVVYTSALNGTSSYLPEATSQEKSMKPVLDLILKEMPSPVVQTGDFQFQIALVSYDNYLGQVAIGRVFRGSIKSGETVSLLQLDGKVRQFRISKLFVFKNLERVPVIEAFAGDIVAISGCDEMTVGETITKLGTTDCLPVIDVQEPTMQMLFSINDSPFAGQDGSMLTMRKIEERLLRELKQDVSLKMYSTDSPNKWLLYGRGELHFSILIEKMRREGFEFQVSSASVLEKEIDGKKYEPFEKVIARAKEDFSGAVIESLSQRGGLLQEMEVKEGQAYLTFSIPTRGMIGYLTEFLTLTKGTGIFYQQFDSYQLAKNQKYLTRKTGSLLSKYTGVVTTYGLENIEDRGTLFVNAGDKVYEGMIIGEHHQSSDLEVNITRKRHLNNMHSATKEATYVLRSTKQMTLEESMSFIKENECAEVTPLEIRLRKYSL